MAQERIRDMFRRAVTSVVAIGAVAAVACSPPPEPPVLQGPSPDEMIASARALDDSFVAAFNDADVEALNGLYWNSPDVVAFLPDGNAIGIDQIRAANAAAMEAMTGATLELFERHYSVVGDSVASWGLWKMTLPGPDGTPIEQSGRYTDLKAQRGGAWVYVMDHASVAMAPPER